MNELLMTVGNKLGARRVLSRRSANTAEKSCRESRLQMRVRSNSNAILGGATYFHQKLKWKAIESFELKSGRILF